jgi:hypothetical protein
VLAGLAVVLMARMLLGYPVCKAEDEHIWSYILDLRDRGLSPPISGPLFVWAAESLGDVLRISHPSSLAVIGASMVPLLVVAMAWAYKHVGAASLPLIGLALACTTYFWAPFMLSRPQQWGQVCFLVGNVMVWRFLKGRSSWGGVTLVFLITSLIHVLSFALLAGTAILIAGLLALRRETSSAAFTKQALSVGIGLTPLVMPGGPYSSLLTEILNRHILFATESLFVAPPLVAATVAMSWAARRRLATLVLDVPAAAIQWLDRHSRIFILGIVAGVVLTVIGQAAILNAEAWVPYGNSAALFLLSQLGNVFFLGLTLCGLSVALRQHVEGRSDEGLVAFALFGICSAFLAVVALLGSFVLRDTNWMLRVLNYGVLIAAPFAAIGLRRFQGSFPLQWLAVAVTFAGLSYFSTIRVPFLFNC